MDAALPLRVSAAAELYRVANLRLFPLSAQFEYPFFVKMTLFHTFNKLYAVNRHNSEVFCVISQDNVRILYNK